MQISKSQMRTEDLDVRTLRLLVSVLETRSLSAAAAALGVSAGTASKLLQKARDAFGDALFVRSGGQMTPTERMGRLAGRLESALALIEGITAPDEPFSPATAKATITVAGADNAVLTLLQPTIGAFFREAPNLKFSVEPMGNDMLERLRSGQTDMGLVMDESLHLGPTFRQRVLVNSHHVLLVREGHPLQALARDRELVPEDLDRFPRIGIMMAKPSGGFREILDTFDHADNHQLKMPHFLAAAFFLKDTDYWITLPKESAERLTHMDDFVILRDPVHGTLPWRPTLIWHERTDGSPLHQWVRSKIVEAAGRLAAK